MHIYKNKQSNIFYNLFTSSRLQRELRQSHREPTLSRQELQSVVAEMLG